MQSVAMKPFAPVTRTVDLGGIEALCEMVSNELCIQAVPEQRDNQNLW